MAFEGRDIPLENAAIDEAAVNEFFANIVDEVSQNRSPVRGPVDKHGQSHQLGFPRLLRPETVGGCVGLGRNEYLALPNRLCRPREVWSTLAQAEVAVQGEKSASKLATQPLGRARDTISRTMRSGSGDIEQEPAACEHPSNDARGRPVSYASPSRTSTCGSRVSHKTPRLFDKVLAAFDAKDRSSRANPTFTQQVQDTSRTTAKVDEAFAWPDPDFVELCVGIRRQIGDLALEPCLFCFTAPEQILVWVAPSISDSSQVMAPALLA